MINLCCCTMRMVAGGLRESLFQGQLPRGTLPAVSLLESVGRFVNMDASYSQAHFNSLIYNITVLICNIIFKICNQTLHVYFIIEVCPAYLRNHSFLFLSQTMNCIHFDAFQNTARRNTGPDDLTIFRAECHYFK